MIFNKIYEKIDGCLFMIRNLKDWSDLYFKNINTTMTETSDSLDFLNREMIALRKDVKEAHNTITGLKEYLQNK